MSKHSPEPWTAQFHNPQKYAGRTHVMITSGNSLVPIAAVVLSAEGCSEDEGRANARLMAASRELLAALKNTLDQLETNYMQAIGKGHTWPNERVNMTSAARLNASAAVAKAERAP